MEIKCLFVDLGDVLYKIDPNKANENLANLNIPIKFSDRNLVPYRGQHPIIDVFEMGQYSSDEFLKLLEEYCPSNTREEIIDAFNSILDTEGFMIDRLKYLEGLSDKLKIYLLSNTNELHLEKILNQNVNLGMFTDKFFSCRLGARKPEILIYQKACELAKIRPEEVLFIDDNHSNIVAAKSFGINTIELKTTDLESFIEAIEKSLK